MKSKVPASLRVIGRSFVDWWDGWLDLFGVILIWLVAQVTIIFGPPATFGMYYVVNHIVNGESMGVRGLIEGARKYFLVSWLWALLNLFAWGTLYTNLVFYGQIEASWGVYIQFLVMLVAYLWLVVQFYTLPFFHELKEPKLLLAMRNAFFTGMASPLFSLILIVVSVIFGFLSFLLIVPVFFGFPAIIAIMGFRALYNRLETYGIRQPEKSPREIEQERSGRIEVPRRDNEE